MGLIKMYIRTIDCITEIVGKLASFCLPAMTAVLLVEVVMRYFFKRPTLWAYDTSIFLFGYCGVLAGAYSLKHNAHIIVDVVFNLFSPRTKAIINSFTYILFFVFMGLFIYYCWDAAIIAIEGGHRTNTHWAPPMGHFKMLLVVGGVLLFLQGFACWFRNLHMAFTGKEMEGV